MMQSRIRHINIRLTIILALTFGISLSVSAQQSQAAANQSLTIRFSPTFEGKPLLLNHTYHWGPDSVVITHFKLLISNWAFTNHGIKVWSYLANDLRNFHLLNASDTNSLTVTFLNIPQVSTNLSFMLGIDSTTSRQGAKSGALDPSNGMYWAWNTGYIMLKIDGISSVSTARKHLFSYHLGGYEGPFKCQQHISIPINNNQIVLAVPIDQWLTPDLIKSRPLVMDVGAKALTLAQQFATLIWTTPR